MSAALQQSALEEAFERPGAPLVRNRNPAARESSRDVADILVAHRRISPQDAQRAREVMATSGKPFAWAAGKLKISNRQDVEIALAIRDSAVKDDPAAFGLSHEIVLVRRPLSREAERFRLATTRLATTNCEARLKGVAIAPAGASVNAPYVAANMAAAFAQLQRKTLLIDSDLRRPTARRLFAMRASAGLAGFLARAADFDEVALSAPIDNLSIICAGDVVRDPQPLLAGPRLREALALARAKYDVVIVLTAPIGTVADGQFAWAIVKSAIVVARKDVTRAEELGLISSVLRQIGAEALGAVLTL
jgi:capsular exopolysaccharide synthesis family protein